MNRVGHYPTDPIAINYQQPEGLPIIKTFLNVFLLLSDGSGEDRSLRSIKLLLEQIEGSKALQFDYPYKVHELYLHIRGITQIAQKDEFGAELWGDFLRLFQEEISFFLPNGQPIKLDFRRELGLLENGEASGPLSLSVLDSYVEKELEQILLIDRLSFSTPFEMEQINPYLQQKEGRFALVARENHQIVGTLFYRPGRIATLARLPEFIGGVGLKLLRFLKRTLDAGGSASKKLSLKVRESNERALRLFQKAGFQEVGRESSCYQLPLENAVIMECECDQFSREQ